MAASAAASVVWLTAITFDSDFGSAATAFFAVLALAFGSVFLFVTGAFSFSGAGFAATRDEEGFAFDALAVLDAEAGAVLTVSFVAAFVAALTGAFALLAVGFFTAGFAIDLLATDLVAAEAVFFAGCVVFAGFFIAFAMESIPTGWIALVAPSEVCAWWSR